MDMVKCVCRAGALLVCGIVVATAVGAVPFELTPPTHSAAKSPLPYGGGVATLTCIEQDWIPTFGITNGVNNIVYALTEFDDGSGSALYAGGSFTIAGSLSAVSGIAKWDGLQWSPLGSGIGGLSDDVYALTVFDDGNGPALYAGGTFTFAGGVSANRIAKWNGTTWSPLGSGMQGPVNALAVFDDGGGPALYAGGFFLTAGGVGAFNIAKWDGLEWSPLINGMNTQVNALAVFDDGTGPALYAGGDFTNVSGITAFYIAKWNGSTWSPLGSGMGGQVNALAVFDDGTGDALYAGGLFNTAGGVSANRIAKWDGLLWSPLGSGTSSRVRSLYVYDDGTGPALYAGGTFTMAGGISSSRIAKWNGSTWSPLGNGIFDSTGNTSILAMLGFDDGTGPALYVGGLFETSPSGDQFIAKWGCTAFCDGLPYNEEILKDLNTLVECMEGPDAGYTGGCSEADRDADGDVDLVDYALLQASMCSPVS